MKKLLCLSIAIIMVLFAATSCFGTTDGTDTLPLDSDRDSSATTPAPKPEFLDIMKDGEFKATIVVVDDGNDYYMIANKLVMSIAKKYDVYPDIEYDTDLDVDSDRVEILIGATNRPESAESKSKLSRSDDYLCELSGNKLLLMGLNEKSTAKAVDYFIYEYITFGEDNSIVYSIADDFFYFNKSSIEINTCAGNPLENYTIVYPADSTMGEYYVALNLRYHMFKKLGMDIPVTDDTANAKTLEILIGDTNRNLAPTVPNGKFSIAVKNSKLCIAANDFFGYLSADKYLTDTLFTNKSEPDTLSASYTYSATADVRPARQGDYRILFNNTWGLHDVAFANRDEYAAAFYLAYQADVVALNELWDPYRADGVIDDVLLANGYVEVIAPNKTEHGDPNTNVLPIFYNPKKVKLIESSYHHSKWYAIGSSEEAMKNGTASLTWADDSKAITIAVFEGLDANGNGTGERFTVCNTHFTSNYYANAHNMPMHGYYSRLNDMKTTWTALQPYLTKYSDSSVIIGCDFNCGLGSDEIKLIESYGFKNCHEEAAMADNDSSAHAYPTYDEFFGYFVSGGYVSNTKYENSIDHAYYYGDTMNIKLFDTLTTKYSCLFSDHSPLLIDFDVVKK